MCVYGTNGLVPRPLCHLARTNKSMRARACVRAWVWVCVDACVRACLRACVRTCVRVSATYFRMYTDHFNTSLIVFDNRLNAACLLLLYIFYPSKQRLTLVISYSKVLN